MKQGNSLIRNIIHLFSAIAMLGAGGTSRKDKKESHRRAAHNLEITETIRNN